MELLKQSSSLMSNKKVSNGICFSENKLSEIPREYSLLLKKVSISWPMGKAFIVCVLGRGEDGKGINVVFLFNWGKMFLCPGWNWKLYPSPDSTHLAAIMFFSFLVRGEKFCPQCSYFSTHGVISCLFIWTCCIYPDVYTLTVSLQVT